jgi:TonB-dependent starch-binding outer membrane protein SusC
MARRSLRNTFLGAFVGIAVPFLSGSLVAQETGIVRGQVTDAATSQPVADVQIQVIGTSLTVTTKSNGQYLFTAVPVGRHTLTARLIGFATAQQEADVASGQAVEVNFSIKAVAVSLDAVVVTGVGAPAERRVLGNTIETVSGSNVNAAPGAGSVDVALEGKVTGAVIKQSTGQPGGNVSVRLRGTSTILGGAEPLWVVDGVIVDNSSDAQISLSANASRGNTAISNRLADISPEDIDHIEVLKGAAAAALYGSRANSGVIQIFTKRGRQGPARVTWRTEVSASQTPKRYALNMAPQAGYTDVLYAGADSIGAPVQRYDVQDSIFRTGLGTTNALSISGGGSGTTYYLSGSYAGSQGIIRPTDNRKTSIHAHVAQQLGAQLNVALTGTFVQNHTNYVPEGEQTQGVLTNVIFTPTSFDPYYNANLGRYPYYPVIGGNPLDVIHNWQAPQDVSRILGSAQATYQPTPHFTIRYLLGIDDYREESKYLQPPFSISASFTGSIQNPVRFSRQVNSELTATHTASLSQLIGLTSTIGFRYTQDHIDDISASATNLPPDQTTVGGATQFASQGITEFRTAGGYIEERAAFANRLYLTGGVNLEGGSAFGPNERWQYYPRLSASWVLSDEPFFATSGLARTVSQLRLRAAYGETGGQPPSAYSQFANYVNVSSGGQPGLVSSTLKGNDQLKPERQRAIEGGVDLGLFQDRASVEFTYYHQRTSDLVLQVPLPPSSGFSSQFQNVGVLVNKGWEAALSTVNVSSQRFTWRSRLQLAGNHNRVEKLVTSADTLVFGYLNAVIPGQPIGVFFGGTYARDANGNIAYAPVVVTQFGKTDTLMLPVRGRDTLPGGAIVNARRVIGNPNPKLTASLGNTFEIGRHLQLSFLLDGQFGAKVANFTRRISELFGADQVVEREINGDTIPRTFSLNPAGRSSIYEEYIENGSYVKLREVAISFRFDQPWVQKLGAETMELRLAGRNLHTWTSYRGLDPEVNLFSASTVARGVDFANTPIPRSFVASVNFTF